MTAMGMVFVERDDVIVTMDTEVRCIVCKQIYIMVLFIWPRFQQTVQDTILTKKYNSIRNTECKLKKHVTPITFTNDGIETEH